MFSLGAFNPLPEQPMSLTQLPELQGQRRRPLFPCTKYTWPLVKVNLRSSEKKHAVASGLRSRRFDPLLHPGMLSSTHCPPPPSREAVPGTDEVSWYIRNRRSPISLER